MEHKTVAYIRVSSPGQVADGVSLERQEAECRQFAKDNNLPEPVIILADRGLSGYKESRPGFKKLLRMIDAGEVGVCICWDLARLSRSLRTVLTFFDERVPKMERFVSLKDNCDTSTPWGKAWISVLGAINQLYRDEISFRTKASLHWKRQNQQKLGGHVPYGWDADKDGNLLPNKVEQDIIAFMRRLRFEAKLPLSAICYELSKLGVKTKTEKSHWSVKVVRDLIHRKEDEIGTRGDVHTDTKTG